MIPISIIIRIIQEFNVLPSISKILDPIMYICGLPSETSLVWITAMIVNLYGGILSLFAIYPSLSSPLSHAQLTVLLTMLLIAHTFPIELKIAQKAGVRLLFMFLFRFTCAIVFGAILSLIYNTFHLLQEPVHLSQVFILQDNIWGPQSNGKTFYPEKWNDSLGKYQHNHMLRELILGVDGENMGGISQGTTYQKTFTYNIPLKISNENMVLEDLYVLVFITEGEPSNIDEYKYNNERVIYVTKSELVLTKEE
jgi:hypothetical protein